jgi:hypothetical protein
MRVSIVHDDALLCMNRSHPGDWSPFPSIQLLLPSSVLSDPETSSPFPGTARTTRSLRVPKTMFATSFAVHGDIAEEIRKETRFVLLLSTVSLALQDYPSVSFFNSQTMLQHTVNHFRLFVPWVECCITAQVLYTSITVARWANRWCYASSRWQLVSTTKIGLV